MKRFNYLVHKLIGETISVASLAFVIGFFGAPTVNAQITIPVPPEYICTGCAGVSAGSTLSDYAWPNKVTNPRVLTFQGVNWGGVVGMAQAPYSKKIYTLHGNNEYEPCALCGPVYSSRVNQVAMNTGQTSLGPQLTLGSKILGFNEGDIAFKPNDPTETLYGVTNAGLLFAVNPLGSGQVTNLGTIAGANYFRRIVAMAFAADGKLYVLDSGNNQIINATDPNNPIAVQINGFPLNASPASMGFISGIGSKLLLYVFGNGVLATVDPANGNATIKAFNIYLDRGFIGAMTPGGFSSAPNFPPCCF
jgi:hypothetical protein